MGVMIPAFFGYYNSQRALLTQQAGLNMINHNIANANTPGYSRQRLDLTAATPYASVNPAVNANTGQIGQGVQVQAFTRINDAYLTRQVRLASQTAGFQEAVRDSLQIAENLSAEPNGQTVSQTMSDFFKEAQSMSINPENVAVRTQFMNRASTLMNTFSEQYNQMYTLRTNLVGDAAVPSSIGTSQLAQNITDVNTKLSQISELNDSILKVSASGGTPNDLMDQRDQLIDELSKQMNVTVTTKATNMVDISLNGTLLVQANKVINTFNVVANPGPVPLPDDVPSLIQLSSTGATVNNSFTSGKIAGILSVGGNTPGVATIRGMMGDMDALFDRIATTINGLQSTGRDAFGNIPLAANANIFNLTAGAGLTIPRYSVNANLITDPRLLAAASGAGPFAGIGDGTNALAMAQLETAPQAPAPFTGLTFAGFYNTIISRLGVNSASADASAKNANDSITGLEQRRQSVQGVNVEEEMVNLMRFQRGFEASSRAFKTLDDTIQTLMNMI